MGTDGTYSGPNKHDQWMGMLLKASVISVSLIAKLWADELVSGTNQAQLLKVASHKVLYVVTVTKHGLVRKSKHQLTSCEGNTKW